MALLVREALERSHGREVKHVGDGIMAVFVAAADALRCATAVQSALAESAHRSAEPLERNGDFFGSTVQLAARLCMQAQPSATLVSAPVVEACADRQFEDVGEFALKGFPEPVRAW